MFMLQFLLLWNEYNNILSNLQLYCEAYIIIYKDYKNIKFKVL